MASSGGAVGCRGRECPCVLFAASTLSILWGVPLIILVIVSPRFRRLMEMGASPDLRPLELRQEDRDLNAADSLTCASLLPIQPLVIVFFHGGHTLFLLDLDVLLRLGRLFLQRLYLGICLVSNSFES